jgi:hypothetical protein
MLIELEAWEYEWASHIGTRRIIANWGKADAPHYKRNRMEDERTASVAGCVAELAVAKATNRYWSGHVWEAKDHKRYRDCPDVGYNIEVRRIRTRREAAVRRHQVGKGLVLFVAEPVMPELTSCLVHGYIDYDKAWEHGIPSDYDAENTRLIHIDHLTKIECKHKNYT